MTKAIPLRYFLKKIPQENHQSFTHAYEFSKKYLKNLLRRTSINYFIHGTEVAKVFFEIQPDADLGQSTFAPRSPPSFGRRKALETSPTHKGQKRLVRSMNALRRLNIDKETKDLDYVVEQFSSDGRLLAMRMAHRLNDIRHLSRFDKKWQRKIANETLTMYTALAGRLGLHRWRYEMEDLCFYLLYPQMAKKIEGLFRANEKLDQISLRRTKALLEKNLMKKGINAQIKTRIKSTYSTYRKMLEKNRQFNELTDRLALRIIVDQHEECYQVLGEVHKWMHPIPGKLKDYIGAPKENGYQSIHTVVYPLPGITEQAMEIQIRTREMDFICEYGSTAHFLYKEKVRNLSTQSSRVQLFRNLEVLKAEAKTPREFEKALRSYFQKGKLIIFDHKEKLYHIKSPSTALDFVRFVYGEKCSRLKKIKINGRQRSGNTPLKDGDVIEVHFRKSKT